MNARHILLGKLWISDRKIIHNGYRNAHTVLKDNLCCTLKFLNSKEVHKDYFRNQEEKKDNLLVRRNELSEAIRRDALMYLMIVSEVRLEEEAEHPVEVKGILKEFLT